MVLSHIKIMKFCEFFLIWHCCPFGAHILHLLFVTSPSPSPSPYVFTFVFFFCMYVFIVVSFLVIFYLHLQAGNFTLYSSFFLLLFSRENKHFKHI
jgi:hypothetical protein